MHHKDWLTYSGWTNRPGQLCYHFSISNDLTQIVNFPTRNPDYDSHSPALLDFFLSSNASIYLFYNGFPSIGKFWSCCCLSFHWFSIKFTTGCPISSHSLWLFLCWLGWSLSSFERCSMGGYLAEDISVLLQQLVNFVSGFSLELMYIFLIENIRSSLTHFICTKRTTLVILK